jgi:hypothetical protein
VNTHPLVPIDDDDNINGVLASGPFVQSSLDLSRFKNEKGEFKKWLQIFYLEDECATRELYFRVTHVLPWLWDDDRVDLQFHAAANALGAYDKYPLVWRSMRWAIQPHERSPHYGMFTANVSRDALNDQIACVTGKSVAVGISWRNTNFWKPLERHVLVPTTWGKLPPKIWTDLTTEKS